MVTKVAGDGSIRRGVLDTAARSDAGKWEELIEQACTASELGAGYLSCDLAR